jgi:hypothetical protein
VFADGRRGDCCCWGEDKLGIVAEPFLALDSMRLAVHTPHAAVGHAEREPGLLAPGEVEEAPARPTQLQLAHPGGGDRSGGDPRLAGAVVVGMAAPHAPQRKLDGRDPVCPVCPVGTFHVVLFGRHARSRSIRLGIWTFVLPMAYAGKIRTITAGRRPRGAAPFGKLHAGRTACAGVAPYLSNTPTMFEDPGRTGSRLRIRSPRIEDCFGMLAFALCLEHVLSGRGDIGGSPPGHRGRCSSLAPCPVCS